ncbi:hypothetical protein ACU686_18105 [Yinghuangia aomiensis]
MVHAGCSSPAVLKEGLATYGEQVRGDVEVRRPAVLRTKRCWAIASLPMAEDMTFAVTVVKNAPSLP